MLTTSRFYTTNNKHSLVASSSDFLLLWNLNLTFIYGIFSCRERSWLEIFHFFVSLGSSTKSVVTGKGKVSSDIDKFLG